MSETAKVHISQFPPHAATNAPPHRYRREAFWAAMEAEYGATVPPALRAEVAALTSAETPDQEGVDCLWDAVVALHETAPYGALILGNKLALYGRSCTPALKLNLDAIAALAPTMRAVGLMIDVQAAR